MIQLQITSFGDSSVLKVAPITQLALKRREVKVRIYFASINPIDVKTRAGLSAIAGKIKDRLPWTPGYDIAGVVEEIGVDVSYLKKGDRVCGMVGFPLTGGGYAESIIVNGDLLSKIDDIDLAQAAALPLAGLTAWQGLFEHGQLQKGQRVLILAGAGGVGHIAVQLAHLVGADVVATASLDNHLFLKELGANAVIDYRDEGWVERVGKVDLVLDLIGGDSAINAMAAIRPQGRLVTVPTMTADDVIAAATDNEITVVGMLVRPDRQQLTTMVTMLRQHELTIEIFAIYPLVEGALAQQQVEGGHTRGKVLLATRSPSNDVSGKN